MKQQKDHANVIFYPPAIYFLPFIASVIYNSVYPAFIFPSAVLGYLLGLALALFGLMFAKRAKQSLKAYGENPKPWTPTNKIVTIGPYRYTRNPIYLSMAAIYLGLSLIFNSLPSVLLLPVILVVVHFGVIRREESYLERKLGKEYLQYKGKVRRWL